MPCRAFSDKRLRSVLPGDTAVKTRQPWNVRGPFWKRSDVLSIANFIAYIRSLRSLSLRRGIFLIFPYRFPCSGFSFFFLFRIPPPRQVPFGRSLRDLLLVARSETERSRVYFSQGGNYGRNRKEKNGSRDLYIRKWKKRLMCIYTYIFRWCDLILTLCVAKFNAQLKNEICLLNYGYANEGFGVNELYISSRVTSE